ncbi:TPA: restriction endonuclease subunit S [Vibrio cholerae]|uniref:restriction endonuclease subunit S n=1 Tax=Vibrio cholerae TaxID=666 RepID=UPI0012AEDE74|nr:restriction endonuclease subunit S [Vibrio cholerae]MCX9535792.1 restriction endonuclease subunit S [Vibrio cholerae]HAS3560763.1 restriction endonuclease subunit S [Vibrio cholerae]HAS3655852.1 restriction endonuclease subunit S [Vibrio cholerae]
MSWPMVKLGDLVRAHYGKALKKEDRKEHGQFGVFGSSGNIGFHDDYVVDYPTLIVGRKGSVGHIVWAPDGGWVIDTAYFLQINEPAKLDLRYLFYALKRANLASKTITTSIPGLNRDDLYDSEIPLPPLAEQKRIAAILDKADAIRRKRQQAIQLADEFLRAVFLEMFGDPVTNPKGWDVLELHQVVDFIGGSTLPPTEEYIGQTKGIAAFKVGDMNSDGNDTFLITPREWAREYSRKHAYAPIGTIVIPKRGGAIGTNKKRITSVESVLDPNLMGITPKNKVSLEYLFYWFQILDLSTISNGSSVPQLNKKDLAPLNILVADKDVHVRFDEIYRNVQATKQKFMSSLYLNELSFSGLSQKAFSGQL